MARNLQQYLKENTYPGRGILLGRCAHGKHAVIAYFIMGRSTNSRNRIFVEDGDGIRTEAFDPSKMEDPSLIIYAPVRVRGKDTIVTNGDQTDTVYDLMGEGKSFAQALKTRTFEPDSPNYTPRISGLVSLRDGDFEYKLSILKSNSGDPSGTRRFTFTYDTPVNGTGHIIHTYESDGDPLPSFLGEPREVAIDCGIDEFTDLVWNALNEDNKVSLFVRYINVEDGSFETRIVNKNQ
ncbi:MAG: IMP cyclohydrolase [Lachnospiraceae bacterium]|nr:IMP cyclohydrolase [Lachnospiraceae bacterium]